jgi:hypothetical protein
MKRKLVFTFIIVLCSWFGFSTVEASARIKYLLNNESEYHYGCVPPCDCPVHMTPISGTFTLVHVKTDSLYVYYSVQNIAWKVDLGDRILKIKGKGRYRIGGEFALTHQLELDLIIDGEEVHLDSGLVVGGSEFPNISILAEQLDAYCRGIGIFVSAKPLLKVKPYRLGHGSTYNEGCVPPCYCPIRSSRLTGTFLLIPSALSDISTYSYYRVRRISWNAVDQDEVIHKIRGRGTYRISDQTTNPVYHQLELDLVIDGGKPQHFDSGSGWI